MKKITYLLMAVFTSILTAQTVNIEGDPHGGNPYATIADAIADATNGDVILISGIHTEPIAFSKGITLRGTDPTTDIIQAAAAAASDASGDRVITISGSDAITIENLTIRYGNSSTPGSGIFIDKATATVTLKNLTISENYTSNNGGGINVAGSNVDIIECTIKENTAAIGGAIAGVPNNAVGFSNTINITKSLIDNNSATNGGGLYINGNKNFGNDYKINTNITNSTISNNTATSGTAAAGGGAIWAKGAVWTTNDGGDGSSCNLNLNLVHTTIYNNSHSSAVKNGFRFTNDGGTPNLSIYNSIIVSADDISQKVLNFANCNLTDVVNSILGGLEGAGDGSEGTPNHIIDNAANNNNKGKTATFAGLSGTLTDEGGNTLVLPISESSNADDYCTAATGITLPTVDQRGYDREGTPDAGAYEYDGVLSAPNFNKSTFEIYPNPATEVINVSSKENIASIKVYSMIGTLVLESYNSKNITVNSLPAGIYLIKVDDKNNNSYTQQIIVE